MTAVSMDDLTQPASVRAVITNPNPLVRNLQITQSYHELSLALDDLLGGGNAAWTAFATWASKQAGTFIRNEELPAPLRHFLGLDPDGRRHPFRRLSELLRRDRFLTYARLTVADVSAHVAEGNVLVYTKLAPIFVDFLALVRSHEEPDPARLGLFLNALTVDPTTGEALHQAFRHYYAARFESDPKRRAERIFVANALVGWHEQVRLQEAINGALGAPIHRALEDPERHLFRGPFPALLRQLAAGLFKLLLGPAIARFEDDWKRVATECLMTLALPHGELRLGDDVPPLPDGTMYPAALAELTLPEAEELVAELDYTPHTTRGSGARDWSHLGDRMNYVVDFFRSRQQAGDLLRPPFLSDQVTAIRANRIPEGKL